jgi:hypothetical protein
METIINSVGLKGAEGYRVCVEVQMMLGGSFFPDNESRTSFKCRTNIISVPSIWEKGSAAEAGK